MENWLKQHADRYYKSLCQCNNPMPSVTSRYHCGTCGGLLPPQQRKPVDIEEELRSMINYLTFALLFVACFICVLLLQAMLN